MKILINISIFFLFFSGFAYAQQELRAVKNDQIKLNTTLTGEKVIWQQSSDKNQWEDIQTVETEQISVTVTDFPVYFRAFLVDCEAFSEIMTVFELKEDADMDGDGILDEADNCISEKNPGQEDADEDGIGDVCDERNDGERTFYWSDATSWDSGRKPQENDLVVIPEGQHIILDENTPQLLGLTIKGTLEFMRKDLSLTSEWIEVMGGHLIIGTEEEPFLQKAILTLNDTDNAEAGSESRRGIVVMKNGTLDLHGKVPDVIWTKINEHALDGSTELTLKDNTDWKVGDEIVVGPTDFFEAASGKSVS